MTSSESGNGSPNFVVGIGASAGGLEAVERMFDRMPADTGMSFVLVQHLSPDFKSVMDELLARWTAMPIQHVEDGMKLEPNAIYLMPPRKHMIISGEHLYLADKEPEDGLSFPIDHFFRSLANDLGDRAIAVVLSGTGSDGSRGVGDIHEANGLVVVQREDTAKFDGMPRSAHDSGVCDMLLAPEEIPEALVSYAKNACSVKANETVVTDSFGSILNVLRDVYDVDFAAYKPPTLHRRIERRSLLSSANDLEQYAGLIQSDRTERDLLYKDLLIGVTRFFRDQQAFSSLANKAISRFVEEATDCTEFRVWIAACATGEEAYSVAMLLDEAIVASNKSLQAKIFATDINAASLDYASRGLYTKEQVVGISKQRLERYFKPADGRYEVTPRLRQMVVFAPHNLLKDPPFTKLDLITCRNFLIYVKPKLQKKIFSLFHFGLKTGGHLFLGSGEACEISGDGFRAVDRDWKIYVKPREGRLPDDMRLQFARATRAIESPPPREDKHPMLSTYDALLGAMMPPSLLIDEEGNLVHTFGDSGKFLEPVQGRQTADILERILPDFRFPISASIRKVLREEGPVTFSSVECQDGAEVYDISATLIHDKIKKQKNVLIQITEVTEIDGQIPTRIDVENISAEQIKALEMELRQSKENLQATIEELESSNEELQAANEELIASNEELQSTNEELHSVNEELYTVNAEHQSKIAQLSELTSDMDHLLESTEVHTVFLDSGLAIRKFTPRIAEKFNFLPQDVGRRIDAFTHSISCEHLTEKIENVIETGNSFQEEVEDRSGNWYLMRILPYRTAMSTEDQIEGALLTLVDVSKLKKTSDALSESIKQRDQFLAMLSHELRNPLGTILNATHLLRNMEIKEIVEPIAVIKRQSSHMSTLLADLLDVTRVSQGKIQLQKRPFDLRQAVDAAIESVQARCDARSQLLVVDVPSEPVWVFGSEPRLLQVMSNLLTNASKYSGHGKPIRLHMRILDNQVIVSVKDDGVGIPTNQIDKVFELFVQSDRTLDRADGGLGVGLTLVRSLVELHGGNVHVQSEGEGKGSQFSFELPLCDAPMPSPTIEPFAKPDGQPSRIVLVEDNVDASKMLAFLLEEAGYHVSIAHDGRRGLELIKREVPDTAVIDIGLPEINGYQLAKNIRQDSSLDGVYLVALTGYGQEADRAEALSSGFDEHLIKPVDPDLLDELIAGRPGQKQRTENTNV